MDIMSDILLNLILMIFPILVYFMYNCYREICMEKYSNLLLDISLVSSMYLCFKFGHINHNIFVILFCNLPIVAAYLKKQYSIAILLSLVVIFYSYHIYSVSIIYMVLKFISYFIIGFLGKVKKVKEKKIILSFVVVQGFFLSTYYFSFMRSDGVLSVFSLFFIMIFFYILPFLLLFLFQLGDQVTSLYFTVSELQKEKKIQESFFKITHEVKNPIAVCRGYLEMLDVTNQEQVVKYIPIIRREIDRSLDIMCDFMEFSKIHIDKDIIDINLLLEDIEDELKILFYHKNVVLDIHVMKNEVFIEGDYNRLKQVFVNLVKNSLEAIEDKGTIKIMTHILKEKYYVEIIDDGKGMDEEELKKVKDMFFTTKQKGSGLGVSLSNEIIKAHQGSIDYYSKLGIGTRVVVKLPILVI